MEIQWIYQWNAIMETQWCYHYYNVYALWDLNAGVYGNTMKLLSKCH